MTNFLKTAIHTLLAAANRRAATMLRKQAAIAAPAHTDYRLNAGGWN